MAGGKGGLVPQIEQGDFIAQQQHAADLRGRDGWWGHGTAGRDESYSLYLHCYARRFNSKRFFARTRYTSALSRRDAPEFFARTFTQKTRAQGKPGAQRAPAASRAKMEKHTSVVTTGSPAARPSLRNGFNGFLRALPGDRAFLPPSPPRSLLLKNLTPASGRQDHTTSPYARPASFVA